jgi:hypothetical protein
MRLLMRCLAMVAGTCSSAQSIVAQGNGHASMDVCGAEASCVYISPLNISRAASGVAFDYGNSHEGRGFQRPCCLRLLFVARPSCHVRLRQHHNIDTETTSHAANDFTQQAEPTNENP